MQCYLQPHRSLVPPSLPLSPSALAPRSAFHLPGQNTSYLAFSCTRASEDAPVLATCFVFCFRCASLPCHPVIIIIVTVDLSTGGVGLYLHQSFFACSCTHFSSPLIIISNSNDSDQTSKQCVCVKVPSASYDDEGEGETPTGKAARECVIGGETATNMLRSLGTTQKVLFSGKLSPSPRLALGLGHGPWSMFSRLLSGNS